MDSRILFGPAELDVIILKQSIIFERIIMMQNELLKILICA